jgi:hypothetical protein
VPSNLICSGRPDYLNLKGKEAIPTVKVTPDCEKSKKNPTIDIT